MPEIGIDGVLDGLAVPDDHGPEPGQIGTSLL
jgi:hypothetical protein